jgi:hypothetical protein
VERASLARPCVIRGLYSGVWVSIRVFYAFFALFRGYSLLGYWLSAIGHARSALFAKSRDWVDAHGAQGW